MINITIIMASYNSNKYIEDAIKSIKNQSYSDWECIIIDDHSKDQTVSKIKSLIKNDERFILIINNKNEGPGKSRNKGINIAKGKYITFLDSDDIWDKDKLKDHLNFIESNNYAISHASYGFINESGQIINKAFHVSKKPVGLKQILIRPELSCLTTIINIDVVGKEYMSIDRRRQDYYLWIKILQKGFKSHGFDKLQSYYRQHNNQPKKGFLYILDHYMFLNTRVKLSPLNSLFYTFSYSIRGILKYFNL